MSFRYSSSSVGVPGLGPAPRHRAARVLAPLALEPELVSGEDHRHAGRRHLQPDPDELALARARDRPEARRVVAVEQGPRVHHRWPRHPGAEGAHRGDSLGAADPPQPGGNPPERRAQLLGKVVAAEPRPHRAMEACVVHRAVPAAAAKVGAVVVTVLGHEHRIVEDRSADGALHRVVEVDVAPAAHHVGDVDPPAVERVRRLEPAAHDVEHPPLQLGRAPVELGQALHAPPRLVAVRERRRRR